MRGADLCQGCLSPGRHLPVARLCKTWVLGPATGHWCLVISGPILYRYAGENAMIWWWRIHILIFIALLLFIQIFLRLPLSKYCCKILLAHLKLVHNLTGLDGGITVSWGAETVWTLRVTRVLCVSDTRENSGKFSARPRSTLPHPLSWEVTLHVDDGHKVGHNNRQ